MPTKGDGRLLGDGHVTEGRALSYGDSFAFGLRTNNLKDVQMGIRDKYEMVPEDDPLWQRFWSAYPRRVSKKEARKAWAKLKPSESDVQMMEEALAWQVQEWAGVEMQFIPHPASYLRSERWTDERPQALTKPPSPMSPAAELVFKTLGGKPS